MKTLVAQGDNPFCGDMVQVTLDVDNGYITRAQWEGYGCSLCEASADYLMITIKDKKTSEVKEIRVKDIMKFITDAPLGRTRMKCVALPLEALQSALSKEA